MISGDPVPVVEQVAYSPSSIAALFRISEDGRVALIRPVGANEVQLTWFERSGEESGTLGPRADYATSHESRLTGHVFCLAARTRKRGIGISF